MYEIANQMTPPRLVKTQLPPPFFPKQVEEKKPKVSVGFRLVQRRRTWGAGGGGGSRRPNENIGGGGGKHIVLPPNNFDNLKN